MWYYNYSEFYPGPLASPITQTSNIIMNTSTPHRKAMDMHAKPSLTHSPPPSQCHLSNSMSKGGSCDAKFFPYKRS